MHKTLLKELISLIKKIDSHDYITKVKYIIFIFSKIIYQCRASEANISEELFFLNITPNFLHNNKNIFNEYEIFNLNISGIESSILNLIKANKDNIDFNDFKPAELYESMLTAGEKKVLGQVYTPVDIINKMLDQLFNLDLIGKNTKLLDPACGGGYFLIEAFKKIKSYFGDEIEDKHIIESMLFGIDVDDFSIFMTKVGLMFAGFSTEAEFNIFRLDYLTDTFEMDKFDIIVGNPPYVGHKNSTCEYKKALYEKYSEVFYNKADISYCFFKKSREILKPGGVISFITSRYFMEALYADRIRAYIKNNFNIISLVDFSGNNIFKGAMVSPALITLENNGWNKSDFSYVLINSDSIEEKFSYSQDKLKDTGWTILKHADEQLFNKIEEKSNIKIQDACKIKQGIITGLDKAFIVDKKTIEKYNIESDLLKKWIKNSNISKSEVQYNNLYLIYSNIINDEKNYPNTIKYLSFYKDKLQNRRECLKGYRKWYELQWGRIQSDFDNPKIIFPFKSTGSNFYFDTNKYYCSADVYIMNNFNTHIPVNYLLSYLNSDVFEFYFKCLAKKVGTNIYEYYPNKLSEAKIYLPLEKAQQNISDLGKISIDILLKKVFNISEEEVNIIYKYVHEG